MTIARTGIQIDVIGASAAQRDLMAVASANDKVSEAAIRERLAIGDAEQAIVKKVRAEQASKKALDDILGPTSAAAKETTALGKAASLAGSGMSVLRKAAELIPGIELGTIFAGIAAGAYAIYKAFDDGDESMKRQTAALQAQAQAANDLAAAQRAVLASQIGAGSAAAKRALDRLGSGATPEAIDTIMRLGASRDAAETAQMEAIQRSTRKAGGLVPVTDSEQRRIEALQASRNKIIAGAEEKVDGDFKLNYADRLLLGRQAQAFQVEIEKIRQQASMAAGWKLPEVVEETTRSLEQLDKQLRGFGADGGGGSGGGGGGSVGSGGGRAVAGPAIWWRGRAGAMMDAADEERARKNRERDFVAPGFAYPRGDAGPGLDAGSFGGYQPTLPGTDQTAPKALRSAMDQMGESFTGTFDRMASGATGAAGIMVQAIGTITGALGSMMTNLIIAGDAGSKGLGKVVGNALAGLSAQAFGYALLLEAMAVAAALTGPILGWGAGGLAAAGGVMAGAGLALGLSARALGADKIGASSSGGGARGGSGGNPAAGTNPFGGGGGGTTQVTVVIGGEVVTRGVQVETRKQELRDGISEGRVRRSA